MDKEVVDMRERIRKFADFWFRAGWFTKLLLAFIALMIVFRLVTSCIKIGIINLEVGCDDPAHYIEEE